MISKPSAVPETTSEGYVEKTVTERARSPRGSRIPSLDGLRAVSILAVLVGHLAGTRGFSGLVTRVVQNRYVDVANLGVRVFFVISGFLITGLLIEEHATTGAISLKRFYLRRTLRIFPAYYASLAILAVLAAAGAAAVTRSDFIHALTYTVNYDARRSWSVGHLWSLAVEEQFYLIWPATVVWAGVNRAWRAAALAVVLVPLIRVAEASFWHGRIDLIGLTFETTADALALGCLLALLRAELFAMAWYRRAVLSWWAAPALLVLGVLASIRYRPGLLIGQTLTNVAILIAIDRCVRRPDGGVGRALNSRALVYVGTLSYSIYLWQQIFLNRASSSAFCAFPLNLMLAALCALASYYLVERPALRARRRIERQVLGEG